MSSEPLFVSTEKQQEYIDAVFSGKYKYLLYGGAIRGGNTYVTLAIIIILCRIFPGSRWVIVRKDLPTLKRNVLPVFDKIAPRPFCGSLNRSSWSVKCANGSEIIFFPESINTDKELNRWKGLEVNGFVFEEANEMTELAFDKAIERAGSWKVPGAENQPPVLILLTCNPSQSWVKERFYNPWVAGKLQAPYYYLPAKITDNPYLSEEYKESLKNLPAHLYRQFVEGDWNVSDDPMQIIPYQPLHDRMIDERELAALIGEEALGIDVGEMGDDATVFAYARGSVIYEIEKFHKKRVDEVSAIAQVKIADHNIAAFRVGVDAVGIGAGVWGNLVGAGLNVQRIIAGGKPVEAALDDPKKAYELQFRDLKTQMWWKFRNDVMTPESELRIINSPSLIQDLTSVRYKIAAEKMIQCEKKDETKLRIGRSPDEGDAAVIANWVRTQHDTTAAIADKLRKLTEPKEKRQIVIPTIHRSNISKFTKRHERSF